MEGKAIKMEVEGKVIKMEVEEVQVDAAGSEEKSDEALSNGSHTTPKRSRGRPRKNRLVSESDQALSNGSSTTPEMEQGRPKRLVTEKGRGRPSGALSNSSTTTPKKSQQKGSISKLGASRITPERGRAKGSVFTKPKMLKVIGKPSQGQPRKVVDSIPKKCGRPIKVKRGRPKKILTPEEEEERKKLESQPRVLKPLGRPRIYPRNDPPVSEPRRRGRPCKTKNKRGDHLRKPPNPNPPNPNPPNPKPPIYDGAPRKRGRPPGAANKKKIEAEQEANSEPPVKRSCNFNEKSEKGFPPVEEDSDMETGDWGK
ncbi:serine/arginine repetitive matrix protein 1-like [Salvelinus namaycush]|uniref:Serine/arginine repetitive matrix protein 1-like n=1 Tax=Salvelinus namaycush TaxID=8040 RepID=A0A8U1C0C2_SALNM|nr:serine/arginine repetitive matrix protein 1-like [Salvelinus namaycush]